MRSVISQSGQNIFDISLKHMGSPEAVYDILKLNPSLRVDQTIPTGTEVFVPETPTNQRVVDYYNLNNINPSTGV